MDAVEAQQLARTLMQQHGLFHWTFAFNRRKRSLGICVYEPRRIELSLPYVIANHVESIRDTILHEIAHALAGQHAHHGPKWKAVCRQIGATPQRCDTVAQMPKGRWTARCPGCQKEFNRHKRPKRNRNYHCAACGSVRGAIKFRLAERPTTGRVARPKVEQVSESKAPDRVLVTTGQQSLWPL